jgi:fatty-acyl-CoA synthase
MTRSQTPGSFERAGRTFRALRSAGVLHPRFLVSMGRGLLRHGNSLAAVVAGGARMRPDETAVVDDAGALTFRELERRVLSIAQGLRAAGVGPGENVGILCRNHRGFVEATAAVNALGADLLFLNTGFAGPQLGEVLERENARNLVYDEEFAEIVESHAGTCRRFVAWHDAESAIPTLDELARRHSPAVPPRPAKPGNTTVLTSGTTGTPKGARRDTSERDPASELGLLEVLPVRVGVETLVCPPVFHGWGLTHSMLALTFASTLILHRRFDPLRTVKTIEERRVDSLVVVPTMMQRILALGEDVLRRHDVSSLRATFSSGSALPGELALAWMDAFGDNLHNFYGSTEVAQATCAGPEDLRAAPGTAGRPPMGTVVEILDEEGRPLPPGQTGRIFVSNTSQFSGYTGGGGKEMIRGLMSIGDVGHFDDEGRLFVEGRDDDMIVSGGENVFPREVEDLLSDHPAILEAAVIGVEDADFGQRLRAFVVPRERATIDESEVQEHVRSQLARHKVPRDVIFLDEIPRNPTGKVLKRVLRERA